MPDSSAGSEILSRMQSLKLDLEAMKEESKHLPLPDGKIEIPAGDININILKPLH